MVSFFYFFNWIFAAKFFFLDFPRAFSLAEKEKKSKFLSKNFAFKTVRCHCAESTEVLQKLDLLFR